MTRLLATCPPPLLHLEAWAWHEGLLRALERGDSAPYRSRMREHVTAIRIRLERAEPAAPPARG